MDEHELDEILQVVDSPSPAPNAFRSRLLDDLRDAFEAPAELGGGSHDVVPEPLVAVAQQMDDNTDLTLLESAGGSFDPVSTRLDRVATARRTLLAVAASAAMILLIVFSVQRDDRGLIDVAEDPGTPATTAPPPLLVEDACARLTGTVRPLVEVGEQGPSIIVVELETWQSAVDGVLERSAAFLSDEEEVGLLETRILIRQAIDAPSQATVVAVERHWRDLTASGPLAFCRA